MNITATQLKNATNSQLLAVAGKIAIEIKKRVASLDASLQQLGVEGLQLAETGKIPVRIRFTAGGKVYCYLAPDHVKVGDLIQTPPSPYNNGEIHSVIGIGSNGYTGYMKDVVAVFKKEQVG